MTQYALSQYAVPFVDNVVWNQADYEGVEPWPPAASLLDLVRCTVVMDDPYDRTFREPLN